MDRAPHDGRWIIAIHRDDPDRRAVIRWDPEGAGDPRPWHAASCQQSDPASCEHGYPADAFTDWMDFPDSPLPERSGPAEGGPGPDGDDGGRAGHAPPMG